MEGVGGMGGWRLRRGGEGREGGREGGREDWLLRGSESSIQGHEVDLAVAGRPYACKKHLRERQGNG